MSELRVIGIDPGPLPGIVLLHYEPGWLRRVEALQCTPGLAPEVVEWMLVDEPVPTLVQVERFVVGNRAGRSRVSSAGEATRELIGALQRVVSLFGRSPDGADAQLLQRSAAAVKPWATDLRLAHSELLDPTKGMPHARDAARHALFAACHDGGIPDPLSKEAVAR